MRSELECRNLSLSEISKLVREKWKSLPPRERESYMREAFNAIERYNVELSEYKKTSQYKEYSRFLVEFKARQSSQQQVTGCQLLRDPPSTNILANSSSPRTSEQSAHKSRDFSAAVKPDQQQTSKDWPGRLAVLDFQREMC
jgi:hypothetical protein